MALFLLGVKIIGIGNVTRTNSESHNQCISRESAVLKPGLSWRTPLKRYIPDFFETIHLSR